MSCNFNLMKTTLGRGWLAGWWGAGGRLTKGCLGNPSLRILDLPADISANKGGLKRHSPPMELNVFLLPSLCWHSVNFIFLFPNLFQREHMTAASASLPRGDEGNVSLGTSQFNITTVLSKLHYFANKEEERSIPSPSPFLPHPLLTLDAQRHKRRVLGRDSRRRRGDDVWMTPTLR